jgi:HK97 family phage prohead protease
MEQIQIKSVIQKEASRYTVVMSKEVTDRDGEIISIAGIDTTNFAKNPVVLDSHRMNTTVFDILGKVIDIQKTVDSLIGVIEFSDTPQGQMAKRLVDQGILKTLSIGFIPKTYEGNVIMNSELLEVSFVAVPSNPEAMVLTSKAYQGEERVEMIKKLNLLAEYKQKIKAYREILQDDALFTRLGLVKGANEIENVSNLIQHLTKAIEPVASEPSSEPVENPQLSEVEIMAKALEKYINS